MNVEIAEGAEVQIIVPEEPSVSNGATTGTLDWLQNPVGIATSGLSTDEIMRLTR